MFNAKYKGRVRAASAVALAAGSLLLAACGSPTAETVCQREATANCSGFDMSACVTTGNAIRDRCASMGLSSQYQSFLNCGANASYTCNASNEPTTSSCALEALQVLPCITGSIGGNDAGTHD